MMRAAAHFSNKIITDSVYSKRDIVRFLNVNPDKVCVIYPGVDEQFGRVREEASLERTKKQFGISKPYLLYTAIHKPRKNHAGLLRAFSELRKMDIDLELVIVGPMDENDLQLPELAISLGVERDVRFLGRVTDCDLRALYSAASTYVCPSLYEGFGFTILEAMSAGVPVVTSGETSLAEVGGDAVLYADARNPIEFAKAIRRVILDSNLRKELVSKGFKNLQRFAWSRAAAQTMHVYEETLGSTVLEKANLGVSRS